MKLNAKAYAKLNLSLSVNPILTKESLHSIISIFQQISLHDTIDIIATKSKNPTFNITYTGFKIPTNTKNILGKIITTLSNQLNHNYSIHINKKIPLGSGMGGASSNAAILLKAINTIEKKSWSYSQLINISKQFGSDISFFLKGGLQEVSGIGDILKPKKPLTKPHFLIIYPNIECSTKEIYHHFDFMIKQKKEAILTESNNLLPVVLDYNKTMKVIYERLSKESPFPIELTGSGSTFFIKTKTENETLKLQKHLKTIFPKFYIQVTKANYDNNRLTIT